MIFLKPKKEFKNEKRGMVILNGLEKFSSHLIESREIIHFLEHNLLDLWISNVEN